MSYWPGSILCCASKAIGDNCFPGLSLKKPFLSGRKPRTPPEEILRPSKILLVEDDDKDAFLIKEHFTGDAYQIEIVSTGEAALDRVQKEGFDLVLLDVILPREKNEEEMVLRSAGRSRASINPGSSGGFDHLPA